MKNFKDGNIEYNLRQKINSGLEQWEKRYEDGQTAWVTVRTPVSRAKVKDAFYEQEDAVENGYRLVHNNSDEE